MRPWVPKRGIADPPAAIVRLRRPEMTRAPAARRPWCFDCSSEQSLASVNRLDLDAPVLGATFGRLVVPDRIRFAAALSLDPPRGHTVRLEVLADGVCAPIRELLVVRVGADRVRIRGQPDPRVGTFRQRPSRLV